MRKVYSFVASNSLLNCSNYSADLTCYRWSSRENSSQISNNVRLCQERSNYIIKSQFKTWCDGVVRYKMQWQSYCNTLCEASSMT